MESFDCVCLAHFGSLEELQAHWNDPERDRIRPHYRLITSGSSSLEHDSELGKTKMKEYFAGERKREEDDA